MEETTKEETTMEETTKEETTKEETTKEETTTNANRLSYADVLKGSNKSLDELMEKLEDEEEGRGLQVGIITCF